MRGGSATTDAANATPGAADLKGVRLVYAASENEAVIDSLQTWARRAGAWVNVLDEPDECDFITPAVVDRDPVVVAIGTEGTAPVLARQIKVMSRPCYPNIWAVSRAQPVLSSASERGSPAGLVDGSGRPSNLQLPHAGISEQDLKLSLSRFSKHEQLTSPEGRIARAGAAPVTQSC